MAVEEGLELYDNTELSTHSKCSRKYFFRHVLHLEREGTAPALAFGLGWHSAMDIVWKMIAEGEQDNKKVVGKAF